AHGMLPYLAQGAATSIEDGAALAECLDRVQDISDIPNMLQAFQAIRKPRCEAIALGARANGDIWHMADGPEQAQSSFVIGNTTLPPGEYTFRMVDNTDLSM